MRTRSRSGLAALGVLAATLGLAPMARAQSTPVPLQYNFNGIVHAGEAGQPDAPMGFRSISDRALDFSGGVPNLAGFEAFHFVDTPNTLDIVHLGNRNTVDFGNRPFDNFPDGDDFGVRPTWLPSVNQTGAQITTLSNPIPTTPSSNLQIAFQISNGGGSFDVTVRSTSGRSFTTQLGGPDWFGGSFAATEGTDSARPGPNLSITRRTIGLSGLAGEPLRVIEFSNRSNPQGGYAILAATVETPAPPRRVNQVPLAFNFNGIVHAGEQGQPDAPNGFRSISDRALDFTGGVPQQPILNGFAIEDRAGVPDIVHIGNRNTVDGSSRPFDVTPNGDDIGVQPAWLTDPDQSVPQVTVLPDPILLEASSTASVLFQISNGGGSFDLVLDFASGNAAFLRLSSGDWFGGPFPGATDTDSGTPGGTLDITEQTVNLSNFAGEVVTRLAFANTDNPNAGYAVLAMNLSGCLACAQPATQQSLGGGTGGLDLSPGPSQLGCEIPWNVTGGTPNSTSVLLGLGVQRLSVPLDLQAFVPSCGAGGLWIPNAIFVPVTIDGMGNGVFTLPPLTNPSACGATLTGQVAEFVTASCPLRFSDAWDVTIGN